MGGCVGGQSGDCQWAGPAMTPLFICRCQAGRPSRRPPRRLPKRRVAGRLAGGPQHLQPRLAAADVAVRAGGAPVEINACTKKTLQKKTLQTDTHVPLACPARHRIP